MNTTYPHAPGVKEHGGCSQEAAELMRKSGKAADLRTKCLQILNDHTHGKTCSELAYQLGEDLGSVAPRMSELFNVGLAYKTDKRRKNIKGNPTAVAKITAAGERMVCAHD